MTRSQNKKLEVFGDYGLWLVGVALLIALIGGWIASRQSLNTIDQSKLEQSVESLQSYAAETHLLLGQYRAHRTLGNYVKVSAAKLQHAVSALGEHLHDQPLDSSVEQRARGAAAQADELSKILGELSRLPASDKAEQLHHQLEQVRQKVDQL